MNKKDFNRILMNKLLTSFDIEKDVDIEGKRFDLRGEFNQEITRYFAFKELTYESFENNEIIFCKNYEGKITREGIGELKAFIKEKCHLLAPPKENHMSTCLTFILVSELEGDEVDKDIKRFHFYRSYLLGFKGWVNCKLICVDPEKGRIITNKRGRKELKFMENILNS